MRQVTMRAISLAEGWPMLNILEFSVLAVAVVIPVAANLLWHLIETDLNDTE
jgi:hypothetical protein